MFLRNYISDFKPHKIGFKKVLGDLEADVMQVIWRNNEMTVRDVYEQLRLEKKHAYTTIMTIMSRLAEKGLLKKKPLGNAYIYSSVVTESEFAKMVVSEVLDSLMEEFAEPAISHIVDKIGLENDSNLEKFAEIIKERRTKGG